MIMNISYCWTKSVFVQYRMIFNYWQKNKPLLPGSIAGPFLELRTAKNSRVDFISNSNTIKQKSIRHIDNKASMKIIIVLAGVWSESGIFLILKKKYK